MAHGRKRKNAILRNKDKYAGSIKCDITCLLILMVDMAHVIVVQYIHTMFDIKTKSISNITEYDYRHG